jgi:hypothetical protein
MKKLLLSSIILFSGIINSQTVFQDNMNAYTVNSQLSGQGSWTNNSSNGGTGSCTGAICTNAQVLTPGFNYLNYGSSSNSVQLLTDTDGCGTLFTPITTGDFYVGLMINASSSTTSPNDFFRVNSGNAFVTSFRVFIKTVTANSFTIGISKGASGNAVAYTSSSYGFNQDHLLILKYSIQSGASDDTVNLYVNPVIANGVPTSPDATTSSGTDQSSSIDRLVFRQNATATPTGRAGLVSIAKSWTGLIFPNLNAFSFEKNQFEVSSLNIKSGILSIKSNKTIDDAIIKIYDIDGRIIETKETSLNNQVNDVAIKPIQESGIYIIEIIGENNMKFSQKMIVK